MKLLYLSFFKELNCYYNHIIAHLKGITNVHVTLIRINIDIILTCNMLGHYGKTFIFQQNYNKFILISLYRWWFGLPLIKLNYDSAVWIEINNNIYWSRVFLKCLGVMLTIYIYVIQLIEDIQCVVNPLQFAHASTCNCNNSWWCHSFVTISYTLRSLP